MENWHGAETLYIRDASLGWPSTYQLWHPRSYWAECFQLWYLYGCDSDGANNSNLATPIHEIKCVLGVSQPNMELWVGFNLFTNMGHLPFSEVNTRDQFFQRASVTILHNLLVFVLVWFEMSTNESCLTYPSLSLHPQFLTIYFSTSHNAKEKK